MKEHRYIVALPFHGAAQTVTFLDGNGVERVAYNHNATLAEYMARPENAKLLVLSQDAFYRLMDEYTQSFRTDPKPESFDAWIEALEVMPPARFFSCNGWELFCMAERLYADMTTWHARKGERCVYFTDSARLPAADLLAKLQ